MKFWPFRHKQEKPRWTIYLHDAVQSDVTVACAWTTYAGIKTFVRTGEYGEMHPEARGHDSPFDEECYARDGMAEFWAAQKELEQSADPYQHLLVRIRNAGFIREYVWRFLRHESWDGPSGLDLDGFDKWAMENKLAQHEPPTHAFIAPEGFQIQGAVPL